MTSTSLEGGAAGEARRTESAASVAFAKRAPCLEICSHGFLPLLQQRLDLLNLALQVPQLLEVMAVLCLLSLQLAAHRVLLRVRLAILTASLALQRLPASA